MTYPPADARAIFVTQQKRTFLAISILLSSPALISQSWAEDNLNKSTINIDLPTLPVTGNPLGVASDELVVPVAVLNGRELSLQREATLGETLKSIPGVSSTFYGPGSSRPIIRGLDGDRVKIMQNGVGILDASSLSFDHAVALDPLVIEQVDVVRGPAALLYGGSAVGGVVNAIDHRIPKEKLDGITGRGEVRYGGADDQKSGAAVVDGGNGVFAIHGDAYKRESDDLDIPGYQASRRLRQQQSENGDPVDLRRGKLGNSSMKSDGGALGASLTFDKGYAGLSYSTFNSNYGSIAEPSVRIDMESNRLDFSSEFHDLGSVISGFKFRMAHTDYQHRELEGGEVGTTFINQGIEGTLEATHAKIGDLTGVVGVQFQNTDFEALGAEAFIPKTSTDNKAFYMYEELPIDLLRDKDLKLSLGGRIEHDKIGSSGGGPNDPNNPGSPRFGAAQTKTFNPFSAAFGVLYSLEHNWSWTGNLAHTERAPTYNELFANGPHFATGQYEVGDSNLALEKSNGIDTQIRWKTEKRSFSIGAFYTKFSNFLSLANSGNQRGADGEINPIEDPLNPGSTLAGEEIIPEARITGVKANFKGFESEAKFRVYENHGNLDLKLRGDYVRATNSDTGQPLPRIAPLKIGVGLDYRLVRFGARLDILHAFEQDRKGPEELSTSAYTSVNTSFTYQLPSKFHLEAFAKINNLLDEEIREHSSFLKDIAPMGRRSLLIGLRGEF
ncbi:MAG: TonB-dependent receptor [Methylotenera sp.]|uniref:TonB-dependent receptor n=1 Tax=Methylotenera sp. TaxID=2051956 RepID=UPI002488D0B7|nr:TonB-dependent receptor [Methylotenera sp.]MDI1307882.1 TonB-dependent receptor [Methylotenera sp.]